MNALDEEFTVETTLGVYCLNPASFFDRVPEDKNLRSLVEGRVEEVKKLILQEKPEAEFYHFGWPSKW